MACHALESVVIVLCPDNRADDCELVHDTGDSRHMFANLDARNFGADWLELTANFGRRVLLEIEHVLVRGPTRQKNHNNGLMRFADAGLSLDAQQLRQCQTTQTERADFEKIAPRNAVTKTRFITVDRQHNACSDLRIEFKYRARDY